MFLGERGDTIVEVAIAMAILGLVVSVAYRLTSLSLELGSDAKLRNQAAEFQQGQSEALRNYRDDYTFSQLQSDVSGFINAVPANSLTACPAAGSPDYNKVFHLAVSGQAWTVQSGPFSPLAGGIFSQCIVANTINGVPSTTELQFSVITSWPARQAGLNNSSVVNYNLANIAPSLPENPCDTNNPPPECSQ